MLLSRYSEAAAAQGSPKSTLWAKAGLLYPWCREMGCYQHKTQTGAVTGILGTLPNSDAVYLSWSRHWGFFSPVPLRSTMNELGAFHGYGHESTAWYWLVLLPRWCCSLFSWQEQTRFHCRQQKSLSWPLMRAELGLFFSHSSMTWYE